METIIIKLLAQLTVCQYRNEELINSFTQFSDLLSVLINRNIYYGIIYIHKLKMPLSRNAKKSLKNYWIQTGVRTPSKFYQFFFVPFSTF